MAAGLLFARPYSLRGSQIDAPGPAPEIELNDANGNLFRLSEQKGKLALIFFGYTSCPDVCPVTLAEMKQVRASLGNKAGQVQFVFITVDPERDTPERQRKYLALFDPAFIGLTGSVAEMEPVWAAYGVYRAVDKNDETAAGYLVEHSARTYLIDRQGRLRLTYAYGTAREDIVQDIRYLLRKD